ncbi:MAG TPA: cation transporting ATPase C-terminal domain-containing protein, partial [Vicinamibacterales bacterium]|nr:cation transporting ATPase C-terminal domain-containing protein [Vicinamibacterales bacterium]
RPLAATIAVATALHFALVYFPPAQRLFGTVALRATDVVVAVLVSAVVFAAAELDKFVRRRAS